MIDGLIKRFLAGQPHAVVGASADRDKYGNIVLRCYQQHNRRVFAVNPREGRIGGLIEGQLAYPDLASLPETPHGVSIITPPAATEQVVEEAGAMGIRHIWLQPGAESKKAIDRCDEWGIECIAGGPCILVVLGWRGQP